MVLLPPKKGAIWSAGSTHYIHWKADKSLAAKTVKLEFTVDGGKNWSPIAAGAPNTGKCLWKVPNRIPPKCRIRISINRPGKFEENRMSLSTGLSQEVSYKWINVTNSAAYAPRDGAGALVFNGKMWLIGGWNPGDKKHFPRICNNEVWSSEDGVTWTLVKPNTFLDQTFDSTLDWEGRHTAGYAVLQDRMWIVGGDVNQGHYQFDVWNSNDGKNWNYVNKVKDVPWGPRALHYTVAFKDKIWVIGGQTIPQFADVDCSFYRDVWNTSDGINWVKLEPKEPYWPQRGMIGGSVVFKDRIWILGGGTYDTPKIPTRKFFNDVWSSADGVNWEQHVENAPWAPRQYHDVAVFDDRMWVMEGYGVGNRNDVWYSADGVNWYEVPNTPWKARHAASPFVYKDALWMVAGNNMEKDVWKLVRADAPEK